MSYSNRRSPDPRVAQDPRRLPPGQVLTEKWPVLHYGNIPRYDISKWRLRVHGEVGNQSERTLDEVRALPATTVHCDIHCVTTWSRFDNDFRGVRFADVARLAQPLPTAHFAIFHCYAGFTTSLPVDALMDDEVLLTWEHNGAELAPEHGYPLRALVPKRYFWKSAKWLESIEFVEHDQLGFWERAGYHNEADPWREERYW
ncbi:MAG TPA: sulfite oxidase-like oxidoreductase [Candidatus Dormibacteraeota bacterium]